MFSAAFIEADEIECLISMIFIIVATLVLQFVFGIVVFDHDWS